VPKIELVEHHIIQRFGWWRYQKGSMRSGCIAMSRVLVLIVVIGAFYGTSANSADKLDRVYSGLVNKKVERVIDLRTHIEEMHYTIDIENSGS